VARVLSRSLAFSGLNEAEADEYYIFTLSVFPEFQNKKLGSKLLKYAESKAEKAGLKKCSLGVTIGNERARRFYERTGYVVVQTCLTPDLEEEIGHRGYYRMLKTLAE
ncbi:MAG: GNAT family N-acetyltransferase, partial [Limisphaerales bacterium]